MGECEGCRLGVGEGQGRRLGVDEGEGVSEGAGWVRVWVRAMGANNRKNI